MALLTPIIGVGFDVHAIKARFRKDPKSYTTVCTSRAYQSGPKPTGSQSTLAFPCFVVGDPRGGLGRARSVEELHSPDVSTRRFFSMPGWRRLACSCEYLAKPVSPSRGLVDDESRKAPWGYMGMPFLRKGIKVNRRTCRAGGVSKVDFFLIVHPLVRTGNHDHARRSVGHAPIVLPERLVPTSPLSLCG